MRALPLALGLLALAGCGEEAPPSDRDEAFATCEDPAYPPQQLRLLTRREYDATVRHLLPFLAGECEADTDCVLTEQSCVGGTCQADPCALHTFVFPAAPGAHQQVHVAGTFNGWAPTVAEGGWPMTYEASEGAWVLKQTIPDGTHQYKFVLDGSDWRSDPANPQTTDDGFGGVNSVVVQQCDGAAEPTGGGFQPSAGLPPESRPPGYAFDNHADAGLVTAVHVDQYLAAAETLASEALSRRADWLACDPAQASCVDDWVRGFGRRAFRRPLTVDEVDRYAGLVSAGATPEQGLSIALQVFLSSPKTLYRSEVGEPVGDGTFLLTPHETAAALAYLLTGGPPDDALLDAAASGALDTPVGVEEQARRLLETPAAREQVGTFAVQWLDAERVLTVDKASPAFDDFTPAVRAAMLAETRRFVTEVAFGKGGRFDDLYTADHTFANQLTAPFYGLEASGMDLQRVEHTEDRAGVLGHGALLAGTAHSDQTSPVRRGLFVRTRLLCQEIPEPPPDAGGVPDVDPTATTRERFDQHTSVAACAGCHQYIDDVGFGFERFDPVGRWRTTENGAPIDPSGNMNDVETLGDDVDAPFQTLPELGAILAKSDRARTCFAEQWHRFHLGREVPEGDCSLDLVDEAFLQSDGSIQELLIAITQAPSFTRRSAP